MTEEVVGGNPGLRGVPAFDPARDVDLVDALNEQLEEGERVLADEREKAQQLLADHAQMQAANNQQTAEALAALGSIPTALSGVRVTPVEDGYLFEVDGSTVTQATVQAAPLGGLLYEVI